MTHFLPELSPITKSLAFAKATPSQILESFHNQNRVAYVKTRIQKKEFFEDSLVNAIRHIQAPKHGSTKYLFVPTKSSWTAIFENMSIGGGGFDDNSTPRKISLFTPCEVVLVSAVIDTEREHKKDSSIPLEYGSNRFDYYRNGECLRAIQVSNSGLSGKWVFDSVGMPLPEECTAKYAKRLIKARFTVDDLDGLLSTAYGISFLDLDYYRPQDGCLLVIETY